MRHFYLKTTVLSIGIRQMKLICTVEYIANLVYFKESSTASLAETSA